MEQTRRHEDSDQTSSENGHYPKLDENRSQDEKSHVTEKEVEEEELSEPKAFRLLPRNANAQLMTAQQIQELEDQELTERQLNAVHRQLMNSLQQEYDDSVQRFIKHYKLYNDLGAQMIAQRISRNWLEIQVLDQLLDKWGMVYCYETKSGVKMVQPRSLLMQRSLLEKEMRQYMEQLGISPRFHKKLKLEKQKMKLKKAKLAARTASPVVDFAAAIEHHKKNEEDE